MVSASPLYTSASLHSLPHRWRLRQVLRMLKQQCVPGMTFADVGCGDGFVTARIAAAMGFMNPAGYDFNPEVLQLAAIQFPSIRWQRWDLQDGPPPEKYDVVTCIETLEHVVELERCVNNLMKLTKKLLLVTAPIEIGPVGVAKFLGKEVLRRPTFNAEHCGSKLTYLRELFSGGDVSRFRRHPHNDHWTLHTGFDYRNLDAVFRRAGVPVVMENRGWNRFYMVRI